MTVETNVGFIGLGAMGFGMALNVRARMPKAATLYVTDVNPAALDAFVDKAAAVGGKVVVVPSAKAVAQNAGVIFSIVPAAQHVKDVYLNPETGVIAAGAASARRVIVECSTIDVESTRTVGNALKDATGDLYVDSPVSGGDQGAAKGTLSVMLGIAKDDPAAAEVREIAAYIGDPKKFFFCGPLGSGLAAKIANNYLSGTILLAVCEAANIGIRWGLDKKVLYDVIHNSTGQSFMADHVFPVGGVVPYAPSSNGYKGGFKSQMMIKDMTLGVEAAKAKGASAVMAEASLTVYREAANDPRCFDHDVSSVYKFLGGEE